jgi:uncharacterized damage-inducible protein DinB
MYTPESLLDIHERAHSGLIKVMEHCRHFSHDDLSRELEGFGYPTIVLQLEHLIGAEEYWIAVLGGNWNTEGSAPKEMTLPLLEEYRHRVAMNTVEFLRDWTTVMLSTPGEFGVWPEGELRRMLPAAVFMRTMTHQYQHRGQILAMCRLLGQPAPATDFSVVA